MNLAQAMNAETGSVREDLPKSAGILAEGADAASHWRTRPTPPAAYFEQRASPIAASCGRRPGAATTDILDAADEAAPDGLAFPQLRARLPQHGLETLKQTLVNLVADGYLRRTGTRRHFRYHRGRPR